MALDRITWTEDGWPLVNSLAGPSALAPNPFGKMDPKEAETADMYIEKVTHTLAKKHRVRVVTSDGMEQIIILGSGALRVSSAAFLQEVRMAEKEIREILES